MKWASEYEEEEKEEDLESGEMVPNGKKTGRIDEKTGKPVMEMGPVERGIDLLAFETLPLKVEAICTMCAPKLLGGSPAPSCSNASLDGSVGAGTSKKSDARFRIASETRRRSPSGHAAAAPLCAE